MNLNNVLLWIAIVILFFLVLRPRLSKYEGTNTMFDLNELSWIPSEIRTKIKNGINDKIIPAMKDLSLILYNKLSSEQKTYLLNDIDIVCDNIANEMNKNKDNITVTENNIN